MIELNAGQGSPANIGGYFLPGDNEVSKIMRPSKCLNKILDEIHI